MKILNPNFAPSPVSPELTAAIEAAIAAAPADKQYIDVADVLKRAEVKNAAVDKQQGTIHQAALDLGLKVVLEE